MAMIDYGAIAFKNGKLISTNMFTPMIDMVGWEDTENDVCYTSFSNEKEPLKLKDNYFAYIGDCDCTIAFYKTTIKIVEKIGEDFLVYIENLNDSFFKWTKWERWINGKIKVTKRNGYLVCKWKYKGDKYKVYFGYGVDFNYYKKYRIVNYYRSPKFRLYKIKRWFKDKAYEWKYCR